MQFTHIPCGPAVNEGELIACDFLERELAAVSQGVLLSNCHFFIHNGTDECDIVLITERGVWVIEVKHWLGGIDADNAHWYHNGKKHRSPVLVVEEKAKKVATLVRRAGFRNISVVGLVVLTHAETFWESQPIEKQIRKVFCCEATLIDAVMGCAYLYKPDNKELTPLEIRRIVNGLSHCMVDPDQRMIGNYRLNQDWMSCHGFDVCTAEHMTIKGRRARVKHYKATGYRSKAELQQAVQRFERDIQALESLAPHPHIVRAYDFFADPYSDDTYWLFLEWVDGQTLQDRLSNTGSPPFAEQLSILQSLTHALEACHAQGILHRNITPASIFLTDDGGVKLGDFDLARVPGVGATVSTTGASAAINKYMAPESRDSFRAVDARADVYALGAVWYDMALPQPPEVVLPPLIDQAVLSADAKYLLRSLIAPKPADRPASAKEVREWLSMLI